jgi:hypothetical protein
VSSERFSAEERLAKSGEDLHRDAERIMRQAREAVHLLMRKGLIAAPPER